MQRRTLLHALVAGGLAPAAALADPWRDVLDTPAQPSALASRGLITGLARAGRRVEDRAFDDVRHASLRTHA